MKLRIWLALIAVYFGWGSAYLAVRFSVETIPPFLGTGALLLVAGLFLYSWRRAAGDPPPTRAHWRSAALIGSLLLLGGYGGVAWAEQRIPSGIAALLVAGDPLWIVLIDALRPSGVRPNRYTAAGVLVGLVGILLLVSPSGDAGRLLRSDLPGILVLLLASLSWAIGSIATRQADLPASSPMGTGMQMLAGSAGLFALATLTGEWGRLDLAAVSSRSIVGWVYLLLVDTLIAFAAFTWLLRVAPTPLVSTHAYVNPLVAVILGALIGGETFGSQTLLASLIIVSAVALINAGWVRLSQPAAPPQVLTPISGDD